MDLKDKNGCYSAEKINAAYAADPKGLISAGEETYHCQVSEFVKLAASARIVLLAGPSGSGKTTTAGKLRDEFIRTGRDGVVVSLDDFYKDRDELPVIDGRVNAEVFEAIDSSLVQLKVTELLSEGRALLPEYDFHIRRGRPNSKPVTLAEGGVVVVEGIHALNRQLIALFDRYPVSKVYVSPHSGFSKNGSMLLTSRQMRQIRRLVRDYLFRASSAEHTFSMWGDVCAAEDLYIRPSVKYADFRIDTTHAYEPCLFEDDAKKVLGELPHESVYYDDARRLLDALAEFTDMDSSLLPSDSLLREFVG